MSDPLATYLHDHMAGSNFAVELLQAMKDGHIENPGPTFVDPLLADIEQDRTSLQQLVDRVPSSGGIVKEAAAWIGEKAARLKFTVGGKNELGEFQALEVLAMGILGKRSLWLALQVAAQLDARLQGADYDLLIARAHAQHAVVEQHRLALASTAFAPAS
jgi:hypothetical protein